MSLTSCPRYGFISGTIFVAVILVIVIAAIAGLIKTKHGKGRYEPTGN